MKKKFPCLAAQIIFILALIASIYSVFCFVTYKKTPGTVIDVVHYSDDTVVHLQYTVNDKVYERTSITERGNQLE